nr:hypothetical protein [Erysipelothrix rhusiopathiae]
MTGSRIYDGELIFIKKTARHRLG